MNMRLAIPVDANKIVPMAAFEVARRDVERGDFGAAEQLLRFLSGAPPRARKIIELPSPRAVRPQTFAEIAGHAFDDHGFLTGSESLR